MKDEPLYSIGELAAAAGVSRRTVRFYVQRGLLPAPLGLGRGQHYGAEHLGRLQEVKRLQLGGVSLDEIRTRLDGVPSGRGGLPATVPPAPAREPQSYVRQALLPGYELHSTSPGRPLDARELAELGAELQRILEGIKEAT